MIAKNFDEYVDKVSSAIQTALNTPLGQELVRDLLYAKLAKDPQLTPEDWNRAKQEFMVYVFSRFVTETPGAMQELSGHVWEEMQHETA